MSRLCQQCVILTIGCALLFVRPLYAEDISITAEVNTNRVTLGSAFQLTLTINGVTNLGEVNIPQFEGFDIQYLGPSTHVSVVNGQYYSSKSFTYSLVPQRSGRFIIQPLNVTINGQNYSTQALEIEIVDASSPLDPMAAEQVSLKDKINIVLRVPKKEVYLNEALPVKIMLLVNDLAVRDIRFPTVGNVGFMIGDFGQPKQYQQVINGLRYDIVEFDTVVYPTRTGELSLGPAQMECNLLIRNMQQRPLGGVFDDDFFNAFFDRAEKKPITLESEPITIKVSELPQADRPENFSGAVGNFEFEASAAPTEVKVGDPVTLRMKIKGRGNLKAFEFPELNDDKNFKTYKPNIKEDTDVKSLEQVVIPLTENVSEVPALSFSFFDPELQKYKTITQGPYPLKVNKLEEGERAQVIGVELSSAPTLQEEVLGQDIVFIKDKLGKLRSVQHAGAGQPLFIAMLVIIVLCWISGVVYFKWTHRLATDEIFARKLKAPKMAKAALHEAHEFMKQGRHKEFYDVLFKTLQQYCAHKFQIAPGAVSAQTLRTKIGQQDGKMVDSLEAIIKESEAVRYASAAVNKETMQQHYHTAAHLIDQLERKFK